MVPWTHSPPGVKVARHTGASGTGDQRLPVGGAGHSPHRYRRLLGRDEGVERPPRECEADVAAAGPRGLVGRRAGG